MTGQRPDPLRPHGFVTPPAREWKPPYRKAWWSRPLSRRAVVLWALVWAGLDYLDVIERWLP